MLKLNACQIYLMSKQDKSSITINRMFSVVHMVIAELVNNGTIVLSPLDKKFKQL